MAEWNGCLFSTPNADYSHAIGDFDDETKCGISVVNHPPNVLVNAARRFHPAHAAEVLKRRARKARKFTLVERYEGDKPLCPKCRHALAG